MSYYYFVASLPELNFDGKVPFPVERFLEDCETILSPVDYFILKEALEFPAGDVFSSQETLLKYKTFLHNLRNGLAQKRAEDLHKDPGDFLRGEKSFVAEIQSLVSEADKISDPYDAERAIDRARWNFLNELLLGHYFDLDTLIIYGLKLKILSRYEEIKSDEGQRNFEQLVKTASNFSFEA